MKYLFNAVKYPEGIGCFDNNWHQVRKFIDANKLDGIEIMFHMDYDILDVPEDIIHGMHLIYWPTWIDLWKNNKDELNSQFENDENIRLYYGGTTNDILINQYLKEFKIAQELGVDYMVFHVSHVQLEHIYEWNFTYTDKEVIDCAVDLINSTFGEEDKGVTLLFENLWWPGLNFKNPQLTEEFFNKIKYPNKGFMLDIGHLMITNPELTTLDAACDYIINTLKEHKNILNYIKGIHLNQSLTGKYIKQSQNEKNNLMKKNEFWDRFSIARQHISNIDTHIPFGNEKILEVINIVDPLYMVYEFLPKDIDDLNTMIEFQNKILGR